MNAKNSIINDYTKSIHTILSSSSILIIVTLIVSSFADAIAAKICETISQGTFCSVILEAGKVAPTAKNKQPQLVLVTNSRETLEKIDNLTNFRYNPQ